MKKLKKLFATISAVTMIASSIIFVTPVPEASALTYNCPSSRGGDGLLQPGQTCEYTPVRHMWFGQVFDMRVHNKGTRTIHYRFVNIWSNEIVDQGYLSAGKRFYKDALMITRQGEYRIELRCTTGSTIYNDCNAEAWFGNFR
ncbi:hypothetical protein [Peribacillus sp. FSL R5-0717]|uniref:hypothetical protein n=1 Tax=Peribacillus sp. FSL R5-0717 TaxID=2975308 RepID=UPI0030F53935